MRRKKEFQKKPIPRNHVRFIKRYTDMSEHALQWRIDCSFPVSTYKAYTTWQTRQCTSNGIFVRCYFTMANAALHLNLHSSA